MAGLLGCTPMRAGEDQRFMGCDHNRGTAGAVSQVAFSQNFPLGGIGRWEGLASAPLPSSGLRLLLLDSPSRAPWPVLWNPLAEAVVSTRHQLAGGPRTSGFILCVKFPVSEPLT